MSTFGGNEAFRNHPMLKFRIKNMFHGFTYGLAGVAVVSVLQALTSHEEHHGPAPADPFKLKVVPQSAVQLNRQVVIADADPATIAKLHL